MNTAQKVPSPVRMVWGRRCEGGRIAARVCRLQTQRPHQGRTYVTPLVILYGWHCDLGGLARALPMLEELLRGRSSRTSSVCPLVAT